MSGVVPDAREAAPRARRFTRRSSAFIGSVNLVAQAADRLLAFGQMALVAGVFGASGRADLYFLAGIVPLTIGTVIGEPLGRAFMTLVVGVDDRRRQVALASAGTAIALALLAGLTLVYLAVALPVVAAVRPGGSASLWPWLAFAPAGLGLGLSGYLQGVLLWRERYGWLAVRAPAASLVGLVLSGAIMAIDRKVALIAIAVSAGYALSAALLLRECTRALGRRWLLAADRPALRDGVATLRKLVGPWAGVFVGGQAIVLVERMIAATLGTGGVSLLAYARGVAATPAVVCSAVASGTYPGLVRAAAAGAHDYLRDSFLRGLRITLFAGATFSFFFVLFGQDLLGLVLQRGNLGSTEVHRTAVLLAHLGLATFAGGVLVYVAQVLYGIDRFASILQVEATVFGFYVVLALWLRRPLDLEGLAVAFSVALSAGSALGVGLIVRRLGIQLAALARRGVAPIVLPVAGVFLVVGGFRLFIDAVGVPVRWQGIAKNGAAVAVLLAAQAVAFVLAPTPEARRARELVRQAPSLAAQLARRR